MKNTHNYKLIHFINFQAVGCDHVLGSGKLKDRCGVCNGNGDSCTLAQSSYTENYQQYSTICPFIDVKSM